MSQHAHARPGPVATATAVARGSTSDMLVRKQCPRCGERYPADFLVCPRDTAILHEASVADDPLVGQVLSETYDVLGVVGEGAMGRVYEARHTRLGTKRFAIKVLHGVSVEVSKGGATAVLGANGAGKTTLLRAICGMINRKGTVVLDGEPIDKLDTADIARRGVAHVPQGRGTFTTLTAEENLRLGAYTRGKSSKLTKDFELVYSYFPRLYERRNQQAGTLSGGEQQMLAVGRALMLEPKLLVLDEPSFGLAPRIVQEIFGIMRKINREQHVSVLVVEQNANLALDFADKACVLETGQVVTSGTPEEMRKNEDVQRAYLGY